MAYGYDPAYSAFMRAMGVEEQAIRAEVRQAGNLATRKVARQSGLFDRRIEQEGQAIRGDQEARGVYASGATANRLSESRGNIELERAEVQASLRDQLQAMQLDAATRVASLRRQGVEQGFQGRTRNAERAAQAAYGNRGSYYR